MWTFISLYFVTVILYFAYLFILDKITCKEKKDLTLSCLILFNLLGFLCGITHETLGATLVLMLIAKGVTLVFLEKSCPFMHYVKLHIGFFVGYCISFFAPGNINRLLSSHSSVRGSLFERLEHSFIVHIGSIFPLDRVQGYSRLILILFIFIIFACICLCAVRIIQKKQLGTFISENLYLITGLVCTPFLWSFLPFRPIYGTSLWSALFFILLFRAIFIYADIGSIIPEFFYKLRFGIICTILLLALTIIINFGWFHSFITTSLKWENSIAHAIQNGHSEVSVPRFSEGPNSDILALEYVNSPDRFEQPIYKHYYEILIIPE